MERTRICAFLWSRLKPPEQGKQELEGLPRMAGQVAPGCKLAACALWGRCPEQGTPPSGLWAGRAGLPLCTGAGKLWPRSSEHLKFYFGVLIHHKSPLLETKRALY